MSTAPLPPISPMGPGSEPDNNPDLVDPDTNNPDLVDPDTENPDVGTRPDDDGPLSQPAPAPKTEEDPNEQLPHWE